MRREFLAVMGGAAGAGARPKCGAREIVRSGELGEVSLCRIQGSGADRMRLRRFIDSVMDGAPKVVSYEQARDQEAGVWFYGTEGTLRVSEQGVQVWSSDGRSWRQ